MVVARYRERPGSPHPYSDHTSKVRRDGLVGLISSKFGELGGFAVAAMMLSLFMIQVKKSVSRKLVR